MKEIDLDILPTNQLEVAKSYHESKELIDQVISSGLSFEEMLEAISTLEFSYNSVIDFRNYLTANASAKMLNVSLKTFYNLTCTNKTPRYKLGRENLYHVKDIKDLYYRRFAHFLFD